jgi:hypothetical protein
VTQTHTADEAGAEPNPLLQATYTLPEEELRWMVLNREQLPAEFSSFDVIKESQLDNESMASRGFGKRTKESLREFGRITGYVREFAVQQGAPTLEDEPAELLLAATVVHLFDDPDGVERWIDDVFVGDFTRSVGKELDDGQQLEGVETLHVAGFHDKAACLLAVQRVQGGSLLSSTVLDFRLGRLLGVAYVVAKGDSQQRDLTQSLGLALEQQMVRVVLGSA